MNRFPAVMQHPPFDMQCAFGDRTEVSNAEVAGAETLIALQDRHHRQAEGHIGQNTEIASEQIAAAVVVLL